MNDQHVARCMDAFPEYWANYTRMAQQISDVEKQASVQHNNNNTTK